MQYQAVLSHLNLTEITPKVTKVASFAEIWESPSTGDKSLHASVNFLPGDIIISFAGKNILTEPNYLTVQISEQEHIMLAPEFLQYINHSCRPNVVFNTRHMLVICVSPIEVGEEFSFFYPSTEWSMAQGFNCNCKTDECLGRIQGAAHLQPNILQRYNISDYIKGKLHNRTKFI